MVKIKKAASIKQQGANDDVITATPVSPISPIPPRQQNFDPVTGASMTGVGSKEIEMFERQDELQMESIRKELEMAPEVKEAGLELTHEEIELPESVIKMGVKQAVGEINLPQAPAMTVPLADDKIVSNTGLLSSVWQSITWLAQWCMRQLKKAHVKLKKVHGKIVRVVTK